MFYAYPLLRDKHQAVGKGRARGGGGGGLRGCGVVITTQRVHFQAHNFQEIKLFLWWKLILYRLCLLLAPKRTTNGFIEYMYPYRNF